MKTKPVTHLSTKAIRIYPLVLFVAALFAFTACSTTSSTEKATTLPAPEGSTSESIKEGVPGGVFVKTVVVSARVTAIDAANRKVTLLGPDGKEFTVTVGPAATNFDQLRVGDMLKATVTEELVVFLDEDGATAPDGAEAVVALAPKGAQPGGVVAETMQVTATIKAIDATNRTATLVLEDGSSQTFPVRDDIDLSKRKVGEKVVFQITEMIAISVEKQ